ncbi:hypothetical protein GGR12_000547 [Brevundimonas lenta]|uniref:Uncharacterized protein n=1 Tax=Brevundimonas lenta TaxID=424796 RepID=A0A7W6NNE5_9CAUL|nr:hypothetical protein [Brevundimonas lenta]
MSPPLRYGAALFRVSGARTRAFARNDDSRERLVNLGFAYAEPVRPR